jgi:GGDEF domain-containing protein/CHASE3 domain sensor protein
MKHSLPYAILELLTPHKLLAKLNITGKMLLGYMTLVVLTVVVVVYVLLSLYRLNSLNNEIVRVYIPTHETADRLLNVLVAQDAYEKRYLNLRGQKFRTLFWDRAEGFRNLSALLNKLPASEPLPFKKINTLHSRYNDLFMEEIKLVSAGDIAGAKALSETELRNTFEHLAEVLRTTSSEARQSQEAMMHRINEIGSEAYYTTMILCLLSILLGTLFGFTITRHIYSSILKLRTATTQIAEGNFHYDPGINTQDEIGDLARAFLSMGKRLKKLEEMYMDASPLTRLPGGVAVENVMNRWLASGCPIAFCVLDLDNFKVFNDHYGYAHGNVVIKETAHIIEAAVKTKGSPDDFVGHIDGDDFVVITTPAHMRDVCAEIIRLFDEKAPQFYDSKDRAKGFIHGKNRQGREMDFPIMTISIAVVTNEQRTVVNTLEASTVAAELKNYAKTFPSSVFVVDKRRTR